MFSFSEIKRFIFKYNPRGIIVDTNILLVFLVGLYDKNFIQSSKMVNNTYKSYSVSDFDLLLKLFACFKKIVITPHVIAEISNLSIQRIESSKLHSYLLSVVDFLRKAEELHIPSSFLLNIPIEVVVEFGYTDLGLIKLSEKENMPILTDEMKLFIHYYKRVPLIKYEYLKYESLQKEMTNSFQTHTRLDDHRQ